MWHVLASPRRLPPLPLISLAVACAFATGTYMLARSLGSGSESHAAASPAPSLHGVAPNAGEFARMFSGMTNQLAAEQGDGTRVLNVDCVEGTTRGHYMCSYGILRPSRPVECHVMQAEWTPSGVDSFRVKMSGRVGRCGSLREALRSLS
jgi:hypothetical protein